MALPEKSGWASKRGDRIKTWKRRFFVLKDRHLYYYKKEGDKQPKGTIYVAKCVVGDGASKTGKDLCFSVSGMNAGGRTYYICAESADDKREWMKAVTEHCGAGLQSVDESAEGEFVVPGHMVKKCSLDDFKLLKVIGRGAFGKVMLVRKHEGEELFAMKVLQKDMLIKRNQVERTNAENKILRQILHPFIVGLRFAFQSPEKLYLVLDYVAGGDLFTHLQKVRRFSLEQARLFGAEILLAFEHLHSLGIVYRDLKPENILMGLDGHLRLTDFGLSKEDMRADDTTSSFCGTPEYLAPEILDNKGYGKDVDWWSMGVLIYEMLVGRPPFYSENVNEMYDKILNEKLTFPIALPDDAKDLLEKLLERDMGKRLGSGHEDASEIKDHPFFSSCEWDKIMGKEIPVTYKPDIDGEDDTKNFDPCFTSEAPVLTMVDSNLDKKAQEQFQGFTFQGDSALSGEASAP